MSTTVKVLIVDDEINVLRSLARLFSDCDFETTTCCSPLEALQLFDTEGPFDIVLSDFMMPVLNGVDLLRRVRSKYPDTVGIILSGHADIQQITTSIDEGLIKHFVTKPWDNGKLIQLMEDEALAITLL